MVPLRCNAAASPQRHATSPQRPAASPQRLAASPHRHASSPQPSREQEGGVVLRHTAPTVPGQLYSHLSAVAGAVTQSARNVAIEARTPHREGRCSPCRSSSPLGSLASRQAPLETLAHRQALLSGSMAHCHASCDIAIMVSASTAARCACQATETMVTLPVCMGCRWSSDTASQIGDVVVAAA